METVLLVVAVIIAGLHLSLDWLNFRRQSSTHIKAEPTVLETENRSGLISKLLKPIRQAFDRFLKWYGNARMIVERTFLAIIGIMVLVMLLTGIIDGADGTGKHMCLALVIGSVSSFLFVLRVSFELFLAFQIRAGKLPDKYTPEFKFKAVLDSICAQSVDDVAQEYDILPNELIEWRELFDESKSEIFGRRRDRIEQHQKRISYNKRKRATNDKLNSSKDGKQN